MNRKPAGRNWAEFIHISGIEKEILSEAGTLHDIFIRIAEPRLGFFLHNLNSFLERNSNMREFREDTLFRSRGREEYFLNMVGAELLNRAYRQEFLQKPRKVLILPACMRANPDSLCAGRLSTIGYTCSECSPGCAVAVLTRLGKTSISRSISSAMNHLYSHKARKRKISGINWVSSGSPVR